VIDKLTIHARPATAAFYAAILGLSPRQLAPGVAVAHVDGFELWLVDSAISGVGGREGPFVPRFVVRDVVAAITAAEAHGGAVVFGPERIGPRVHAALRDPDGRDLEIVASDEV
jgi:catechol 2,3-dioxygenase-like lactoylglutathione lyase family enzyme